MGAVLKFGIWSSSSCICCYGKKRAAISRLTGCTIVLFCDVEAAVARGERLESNMAAHR